MKMRPGHKGWLALFHVLPSSTASGDPLIHFLVIIRTYDRVVNPLILEIWIFAVLSVNSIRFMLDCSISTHQNNQNMIGDSVGKEVARKLKSVPTSKIKTKAPV